MKRLMLLAVLLLAATSSAHAQYGVGVGVQRQVIVRQAPGVIVQRQVIVQQVPVVVRAAPKRVGPVRRFIRRIL